MNKSRINKKIVTAMVGLLFVGGVAAMLGIIRTVKNAVREPDFI